MFVRNELPSEYRPYSELNLCSNKILGGGLPFEIHGEIPLLVGKNEGPKIWLAGPEHPAKRGWVHLVRANRVSEDAEFLKLSRPNPRRIVIRLRQAVILAVEEETEEKARVFKLDFRPIGLNLHGTPSVLHLGGGTFTENTFEGVSVVFSIGSDSEEPASATE